MCHFVDPSFPTATACRGQCRRRERVIRPPMPDLVLVWESGSLPFVGYLCHSPWPYFTHSPCGVLALSRRAGGLFRSSLSFQLLLRISSQSITLPHAAFGRRVRHTARLYSLQQPVFAFFFGTLVTARGVPSHRLCGYVESRGNTSCGISTTACRFKFLRSIRHSQWQWPT